MASTKLRLLIDESITEPLASNIMTLVPSAVLSKQKVGQGAKDEEVAAYANSDDRIIVAMDADFAKHTVKCGVIKFIGGRTADDCLFLIFRAFWQSGFRGQSRTHRTFLSNSAVRIKNGLILEHKWNPKPCRNQE